MIARNLTPEQFKQVVEENQEALDILAPHDTLEMTVFVVTELLDYDSTEIVAVYATRALAQAHVDREKWPSHFGVEEHPVLTVLAQLD